MGTLPDSGLMARKIGQSRRVVCASPACLAQRGVPADPGALADHNCLGFNFRRWQNGWPFRRDGQDFDQPVAGNLLANNGATLRQMALAGVGLARLGLFHVASDLASGTLVPVLEAFNPGDPEPVHAVHVGGGPVPRRLRAFVDHLPENLPRDLFGG